MGQHERPTGQSSPSRGRRFAVIAIALSLLAGGVAAWLHWPRGTLVEIINETGGPLDNVLIGGEFGVLAKLGRIEPGGRAAARVPNSGTRDLVITHQQQGEPRILDYRFGWRFLDDLIMKPYIRVGIRKNASMNYIQRRRFYADPLD